MCRDLLTNALRKKSGEPPKRLQKDKTKVHE